MSPVHGVIIAGGQGQRLGGVRKAHLRVGGRRLIERVATALGPLETLMVAAGPAAGTHEPLQNAVVVDDLDSDLAGPLAGLVAAVAALQTRGIVDGLLVSVAVDTPFLPAEMVSILRASLGDATCCYVTWQDQFYPPNALWRLEALQHLPGQVLHGRAPQSLRALQLSLGAQSVEWSGRTAENPFANVNTLEDLLTLERRAEKGPLSPLIHKRGN